MPKAPKLQTNFTGGELSPRIEGRPDIAKYFNGCKTLENFLVYPQGGAYRRPGTRFSAEAKPPLDDFHPPRLIPFEFSLTQAYMLEFGHQYIRFYKDGARLGAPYELATPYLDTDIFSIQYRQSADVLFLFHPSYAPRKLTRLADTTWRIEEITFNPPPSIEEDLYLNADISATATTGTGVTITASAAVFLASDVGRQIRGIGGLAGKATIVGFTSTTIVTVDVIETIHIGYVASNWFLRGSPQATLTPSAVRPVDAKVTLTAGAAAFRATDVGKYIKIWGGIVKIITFTSATVVVGTLLREMTLAPSTGSLDALAGTWTLEETAWSAAFGYPGCVEFHEGRLLAGATAARPTTFWGSVSDDYENFAVGELADDAIEYTVASRRVNFLRWMTSLQELFLGTGEDELLAQGPGDNLPIGGDSIPDVKPKSNVGSMAMQPVLVGNGLIFAQKGARKVFDYTYQVQFGSFIPADLTLMAEHITAPALLQDKIAFQKESTATFYMVRTDGQLLALTYNRLEEITAWSRIVTDGTIESVAAIPKGNLVQVWVVVRRVIGGLSKRYVEYFEESAAEMSARAWQQLLTDSAFVYSGAATTTISGISHLAGESVDVIADGCYRGRHTVSAGGVVTLSIAASKVEVGLPYTATLKTMRPAIPGAMIEGYKRKWNTIFLRLKDSLGATVNGEALNFNVGGQSMDAAPALFTGDKQAKALGWDLDGYIEVVQSQPYPLHILSIFGDLEIAESMG